MSGAKGIDLSRLPAPDVIETLKFDALLQAIKDDFKRRAPQHAKTLDLESEPLAKLLQSAAYTAMHLRQRVNDAARSVMLAYATGRDLDHLAALFNVVRLEIGPANTQATPPVNAKMEDDGKLRARVQMALEGVSSAGSISAYRYHGLSADGQVKDIGVDSPKPGQVRISVLSKTANGAADASLLVKVREKLTAEKVRPLTDTVTVQGADIRAYAISAKLHIGPGPDKEVVRKAADKAARAYSGAQHKLGADIRLSALYAALHLSGVEQVTLTAPASDLVCQAHQAPWCTGVSVTAT